jgi:hypothetical protein
VNHANTPSDLLRDDQTSIVWFISFGDLLTLLVCFFFVLTPRLSFEQRKDMKEELVTLDGVKESRSGTVFANLPLGPTGVGGSSLLITRLGSHDAAWRSELTDAWKSFRALAAESPRDVNVKICSGVDQRQVAEAVMVEIKERVKQLRSWSLEFVALCDEGQVASGSEVVAVLEFSES